MNLGDEGAFFYKQISISGLCLWLGGDGTWGHGDCWHWQCWGQVDLVGCEGFSNLSSSMIPHHFAGLVSSLGVACAVVALCTGACQFAAPATSVPMSAPCSCPGVPIILVFSPAMNF